MNNIQDKLYDKNLIHIIPDFGEINVVPEHILSDTIIAVNLYYEDTLERYFAYLDNVPAAIDIYIISSNSLAWNKIDEYASGRKNVFFLKKENRGRDISALLVTVRERVLTKRFMCFIHDKKSNHKYLKADTEYWIENLWSNTLNSEQYILNVLNLLQNSKTGVLTPPKPIGEYFDYWYAGSWGSDFEITNQLAEKLDLKCELDINKSPITLGTVFWCKVDALYKLFKYNWSYDNFPEEPLPADGTINHGIERILAYVAQDAGYSTEVIMCAQYSESLILKVQKQMQETYCILKENLKIENLQRLRELDRQREIVRAVFAEYNKVYLYGAGEEGKKAVDRIRMWGYMPEGFVVTDKKGLNQEFVKNLPVYDIKEIINDGNIGIIVTVGKKFCDEIVTVLREKDFNNYQVLGVV
ncbi:MAG: rhamnan synthesis F family protein [Lachnospiraceae bacterium]|nr:rhamnan synthesis F family protein [Lachnospiraceae bacterium]